MDYNEFADKIRDFANSEGIRLGTLSFSGPGMENLDLRINAGPHPSYSAHQEKVLGILRSARDIYSERAAVYKDNYKVVGRVMEALFPDGAPRLQAREDYDRWHIFELMIVKMTRYTNNYNQPHQDSLDDLLVYAAILGALDREFYEIEEAREVEKVEEERKRHTWNESLLLKDDPDLEDLLDF